MNIFLPQFINQFFLESWLENGYPYLLSLSLSFHYSFLFYPYLALINSFSTGQPYTNHSFMPVYQTLATLTNQSDCWLCQYLGSVKEPKIVFAPVNVNTWQTDYRRWMSDRVQYLQQDKQQSASSSTGESFGPPENLFRSSSTVPCPGKDNRKKYFFCIENRHDSGLFPDRLPGQYAIKLWFESTEGIYTHSRKS